METINMLYRIAASALFTVLTLVTVVSISVMVVHSNGVALFLLGS